MADSFLFYDLETSGLNPRSDRVMQFAGQRTDMALKPIGMPINILIKLTADVLPDPNAILTTGITPQMAEQNGVSEASFLKTFYELAVQPNTIFLGFNSLRFDDEFMRFLNYRNFYDPYAWEWENGCSRWDLLDVVRMTRALKPEGLNWPIDKDGKPTNRLELLTKINDLKHENAHDALGDVNATIMLAKFLKSKQPDLFDHLLAIRGKRQVEQIVNIGQPFTYTTGRYSSEYLNTSEAVFIGNVQTGALVYDLRYDPKEYINMSLAELSKAMAYSKDPQQLRLPVSVLKYNQCPAVITGTIKDKATLGRLKLDPKSVDDNLKFLESNPEFIEKLLKAQLKQTPVYRAQISLLDDPMTVDSRLYDSFLSDQDRLSLSEVRTAPPDKLNHLNFSFEDSRLSSLLPLYKARNYPEQLDDDERKSWQIFCKNKLKDGGSSSQATRFNVQLKRLLAIQNLSDKKCQLLLELERYKN